MERLPEPELMLDEEQARAYAEADFSVPHQMFVRLFRERFGPQLSGKVLDLGCGPADITVRFAKAYPEVEIHGVDGSPSMLRYGERRLQREGLQHRIKLILGRIPEIELPESRYDAVIVNSLLHHLPRPEILWEEIKRWARPKAKVFVMDLLRPSSQEEARALVEKYAALEPEVLKRDFYHSLLAAYRVDEVQEQLRCSSLGHFKLEKVTDRHFIAYGYL